MHKSRQIKCIHVTISDFESVYLSNHLLVQGLLQPGHRTRSKKVKTPFFEGCFKFLSVGNTNGSKTSPKLEMVRGKGKNCLKLKFLAFLKSGHQKFNENGLYKSNFSKEGNKSP